MTSEKENKNYKGKDTMSPDKIKSHESSAGKSDSDADIVEGGYWH